MGRYILRYTASPTAPAEQTRAIVATPGIKVVDRSPNMLLVDGDETTLRKTIGGLGGWSLHPEQQVPLPDTRQKLK